MRRVWARLLVTRSSATFEGGEMVEWIDVDGEYHARHFMTAKRARAFAASL